MRTGHLKDLSPPTVYAQVTVLKTLGRIFCWEGAEAAFTSGYAFSLSALSSEEKHAQTMAVTPMHVSS